MEKATARCPLGITTCQVTMCRDERAAAVAALGSMHLLKEHQGKENS